MSLTTERASRDRPRPARSPAPGWGIWKRWRQSGQFSFCPASSAIASKGLEQRGQRKLNTPKLLLIELGDRHPRDVRHQISFVEDLNQIPIQYSITLRPQHMGVVVDPDLTCDSERAVFTCAPFRTILPNQNEGFIKKESFDMI